MQRLGRVLRKGNQAHKLAILYEVVTEATSEERTSERRCTPPTPQVAQLGILPPALPCAAESQGDHPYPIDWGEESTPKP